MEFEFAMPLPVNFTVGDNNFENSKQKYPRRIKLFIPLQSIDGFCNHLQAMKNNSELHKDGKVFDMQQGTQMEVKGVNLWGNGKKNTFDNDENDYGAFGTINPKMLDEAKIMAEAKINEISTSEPPKADYDMEWDKDEIPF